MKNTIAACILLLVVACVCAVQLERFRNGLTGAMSLGLNDGVELKFNCSAATMENYWKSLSVGCADTLMTGNSANIQSAAVRLCEICGRPLYELVRACVDQSVRFLHSLDILCATNGKGERCYNVIASSGEEGRKEYFADCESEPCSASCEADLDESNEKHGCCMYSAVALLADINTAQKLWSRCEIEPPNICSGAFSDSLISPSEEPRPTTERSAAISNQLISVVNAYVVFLIMLLQQ